MFSRFLFFFLFVIISGTAFSQGQDEQLSQQFFANGAFDKAVVIFEKLYSKKPEDPYLYENLLKCYLSMKQYDEAEKLVKRAQKRNRDNPSFTVDLGYVYHQAGQPEKAKEVFDALMKTQKADEYYTNLLAKAFQKRGEWAYAAESCLKFRKSAKQPMAFSLELANIYAQQGKDAEMIEEYLNLLASDDSQLEEVEGFLGIYCEGRPAASEQLKKALLKRIQDMPERMVYPEFLMWVYTQQMQYEAAFVQCKALDKRFKLNGMRLFDFAELMKSLKQLDVAIRAYQAVVDLGAENPNLHAARFGLLEVRNEKLLSENYSRADLLALERDYVQNINELGINYISASFVKDLAHLQAFYLNKTDSAIYLLKELINMPRVSAHLKAQGKLELGDVYTFVNEVWEATLMYEQVDYDFKEDPLGQEAKYRNARLSYYRGDFEWAQAQLDVLKTATSQLISNNAIELALLIQDNIGADSLKEPLGLFAMAELLVYRNRPDSALQVLNALEKEPSASELIDDILFQKGSIYLKKRDYPKAISYFEQVWKSHGKGILADNALIENARIFERFLHEKEKAMELYDRFISSYPGSFFISEARLHYRLLRGDRLSQ